MVVGENEKCSSYRLLFRLPTANLLPLIPIYIQSIFLSYRQAIDIYRFRGWIAVFLESQGSISCILLWNIRSFCHVTWQFPFLSLTFFELRRGSRRQFWKGGRIFFHYPETDLRNKDYTRNRQQNRETYIKILIHTRNAWEGEKLVCFSVRACVCECRGKTRWKKICNCDHWRLEQSWDIEGESDACTQLRWKYEKVRKIRSYHDVCII